VFVASADAGVTDLSEQQICDIWSGRVTRWKEVGGSELPIAVRDRPEHGSNKQAIRENFACFADLKVASRVIGDEKNSDLIKSMKELSGAIGFMPLSEAKLTHYKLGIGLGFVYKKPLSPDIMAFIDYLKTETVREVIRQTGHIPTWRHEVIVQAKSPIR